MPVGDWSDTTDFWTGTPPILISAIKANTMFLNTYRLYRGAERFSEAMRYTVTYDVMSGTHYYSFRITDQCPWDRLDIIEKIKTNQAGTGNLSLIVAHVGVGVLRNATLDCEDYSADFTWIDVLSDEDITGWGAGNHRISVTWQPSGGAGCTEVETKCWHGILKASLT